jgi:hypothetical protein
MASASFEPEPDLAPLYPTPATVSPLLSPNFGLESGQKAELVTHCLIRACVFGELSLMTYLLRDPQAQLHVDLCVRDEDDIGLISTTILGFGSDSDRDIEREECVRLLLSEGADVETPDKGVLLFFLVILVSLLISLSGGWLHDQLDGRPYITLPFSPPRPSFPISLNQGVPRLHEHDEI